MSNETKAVVKNHRISDEVVKLSEKIEKNIELNAKTGAAEDKSSSYEENLLDGLTMDIVNKVSDYNTQYIAASTLAFGNVSVAAMAGNKDLKQTSVQFNMGRDSLGLTMDRSRTYPNNLEGGVEVTKYGIVTQSYDVKSGHNAADLKAAKLIIKDLAMEKLSK